MGYPHAQPSDGTGWIVEFGNLFKGKDFLLARSGGVDPHHLEVLTWRRFLFPQQLKVYRTCSVCFTGIYMCILCFWDQGLTFAEASHCFRLFVHLLTVD